MKETDTYYKAEKICPECGNTEQTCVCQNKVYKYVNFCKKMSCIVGSLRCLECEHIIKQTKNHEVFIFCELMIKRG